MYAISATWSFTTKLNGNLSTNIIMKCNHIYRHHSSFISVAVTLERNYNLRAGKIAQSKCVEVRWNKVPSGACRVRYDTKFADISGKEISKQHGFNSDHIKLCGLERFDEITQVELTVTYKIMKKVIITQVSNKPLALIAPMTKTGRLFMCIKLNIFKSMQSDIDRMILFHVLNMLCIVNKCLTSLRKITSAA